MDESTGRVSGGGVPAHHDIGVAALFQVRIKDRFAGRTGPPAVASDGLRRSGAKILR
jgi:hypothetical protein